MTATRPPLIPPSSSVIPINDFGQTYDSTIASRSRLSAASWLAHEQISSTDTELLGGSCTRRDARPDRNRSMGSTPMRPCLSGALFHVGRRVNVFLKEIPQEISSSPIAEG